MAYELYYWPGIQGRGEFIRLALEEAGAEYVDVGLSRSCGRLPYQVHASAGSDQRRACRAGAAPKAPGSLATAP